MRFFLIAVLVCLPVAAQDARFAKELARECDALIGSLMKKPYGWGVGHDETNAAAPRGIFAVSLEPDGTPAAALILQYAGRLLEEPKYIEAAQNLARGIAASQLPNGKFPTIAHFGGSVSKAEKAGPLPDRASTRACVAALLSIVDGMEKDNEQLTRAAARGASWVARQQVDSGAWQTAWPPNAEAREMKRIYRLDTSGTRDDVYTMLLAHQVQGDAAHRRAVEKSIEFLLKTRLHESVKVGGGLWTSAYTLAAFEVEGIREFPQDATDVLASRYAVQTIIGAYVVLGMGNLGAPMDVCLASLRELPRTEAGTLHRRYTLRGEPMESLESQERKVGFGPRPAEDADFGVSETTATLAMLREIGREKFKERLEESFNTKQRLAQALIGLNDQPMSPEFPKARDEVEAYLKKYEAHLGGEFESRARKIWMLYLRARLEKLAQ